MRVLTVTCAFLISFLVIASYAEAKTAGEINASVAAALNRFYKQVDGAKEFAAQAKALLVMPNVTKAGFFAGGQYGEGALRGRKTRGYYNLVAGSFRVYLRCPENGYHYSLHDRRCITEF